MSKRYCSVSSCPNFLGTLDQSIKFFLSPQFDQKLLEKWKEAVNCQRSRLRLCISHFRAEDIVRSGKQISLRKNAVPIAGPVTEPEIFIADNNVDNSVDVSSMERIEMRDIESIAPIKEEPIAPELLCPSCIDFDIQLKAARAKIELLEKRLWEANIKIRRLESGIQTENIKYDMISHNKEEPIDQEEDKLYNESIEVFRMDETSSDDSMHVTKVHDNSRSKVVAVHRPLINSKPYEKVVQTSCQSSSFEYATHTPAQNVLKNYFQCGRCDETFASATELRQHMMNHQKVPCELCSDIYTSQKQLSIHVKECHEPKKKAIKEIEKPKEKEKKKKIFQCFICKAEFNVSYELHAHMKLHVRDQPCKVCKVLFTVNELNSHLCGDGESIRCDYCTHEFTATLKLLDHIESSHENKKFYGCEKCPKFYPMLALKDIHVESHARDVPKPFECKICSTAFVSNDRLKEHIKKKHERIKSHLCDLCGKSFFSMRNLELHKNSSIHSDQPQFKCPDCPQKFFKSYDLKNHSDIHKNDKYVCEVCKKELVSTISYRKHMRKHRPRERKFECKVCPMKFFASKNLKSHQAVHTDKRSFKCQFCDQSYKYSGDLNKHLKTHLGDKIHECKKCQQRFQYARELQKHEFQHYKADKEANKIAD